MVFSSPEPLGTGLTTKAKALGSKGANFAGRKMAARNRGKMWGNDATGLLIDLWSEETIQFALESSKTSKETREVYHTLQVSNTFC